MTEEYLNIFTRTLYGEARGEYKAFGPGALIAVANVIMNRMKKGGRFGGTVKEVCLKPKQFSCWNENDPNYALLTGVELLKEPLYKICQEVAEKVGSGSWPDLTRGSDHYHASSCHPFWAKPENVKLRLGRHIFYQID